MPRARSVAFFLLLAAAPLATAADFEAGVAAAQAEDYESARREWEPLADQGHRDAQFNMGLLYENGLGVAKDGRRAAYWYERAAEQEDRMAQAYLAEMYAKGLGVERDDAAALKWYKRAAELGLAKAQYNVGFFYATGRGVPPDIVQAHAWLTVARERGAPNPMLRDTLARSMSEAQLAESRKIAEDVRRQCRLD